ncbi:efflux RND transporter periplasmic adaptor subunit [Paenibacillus assamensis]|uniref:efflux RND transporter periplasmic adaptor subunit n=1 Tax=Paenibacillus assamensis TaxID=311244 RepID=UPI0003FC5C0B|nr:biotin/lipoyl-binding protein [Paenibacillus assamensis]
MNIGVQILKDGNDAKRKRYIQVAFLLFIGVLIFFTLFSNTLESIRLPKVTTEKPILGAVEHKLEGKAVLQPIVEVKLVGPVEWEVQTIHVKEGDRVKKGQLLIRYDSTDAERELLNDTAEWKKEQIVLQNIQDKFIEIAREGDEMAVRTAKRDLATHKLNMEILERNILEKREKLAAKKEIVAPFDGLITKLNAVQGMRSSGEPDVLIADSRAGHQFELQVDAALVSNLELAVHRKIAVEVPITSKQPARTIDGTIMNIAHAASRMEQLNQESSEGASVSVTQMMIQVKLIDPTLKGGEQVSVTVTNRSKEQGLLILDKAVHQDRKGKFVYKVEEQRGALGNVFVARKVKIDYMESSEHDTMIQSNELVEDDQIILESSEPLQDNNRIRLE